MTSPSFVQALSSSTSTSVAISVLQNTQRKNFYDKNNHLPTSILAVFPKLIPNTQEWYELLAQGSQSLIVGDIPQSVLENCAPHEIRPESLFVAGSKKHSRQLKKCFPHTEIVFEETNALEQETIPEASDIPFVISGTMDIDSAQFLIGYTGMIQINGAQLPIWFDDVYLKSSWKGPNSTRIIFGVEIESCIITLIVK